MPGSYSSAHKHSVRAPPLQPATSAVFYSSGDGCAFFVGTVSTLLSRGPPHVVREHQRDQSRAMKEEVHIAARGAWAKCAIHHPYQKYTEVN